MSSAMDNDWLRDAENAGLRSSLTPKKKKKQRQPQEDKTAVLRFTWQPGDVQFEDAGKAGTDAADETASADEDE